MKKSKQIKSEEKFNESPKINLAKTVSTTSDITISNTIKPCSKNQFLQEMQRETKILFDLFTVDSQLFDRAKTAEEIIAFVKKYKRLFYSTISNHVFSLADSIYSYPKDSNQDIFGTILSNVENLVSFVDDDNLQKELPKECNSDENIEILKRVVFKLWDHVNLAYGQYIKLKQSDSEYDNKFHNRIIKFQSSITSEVNTQLLSMVSIFTALAFVLFGGISSLQNLLSGLKESHILILLIVGSSWIFGMLNICFVFLFCIGKMTKHNFKSSQNPNATFWQRYPVFCWTNFLLIAMISISLWFFFFLKHGYFKWINPYLESYPMEASFISLFLMLSGFYFFFQIIAKKTKAVVGDEDG